MRVSEFRRFFQGAALAATIAAAGAMTPSYVSAQTASDSAAVAVRTDDDLDDMDDDDTDLGWLGLLGLAGLLGLRRRERVHHVDRVDRVDYTDTTRRPL